MHIGKWAILLSIFWLLLSGFLQPLLLSFGAISVSAVLLILYRMDVIDKEQIQLQSFHKIFHYLIWLIGQIAISSFHVTKLVWGNAKDISPSLDKVSLKDIPADKRVLYANSITLTPGTLSVDLDENEISVHALESSSIEELKEGSMQRKISNLWSNKDD